MPGIAEMSIARMRARGMLRKRNMPTILSPVLKRWLRWRVDRRVEGALDPGYVEVHGMHVPAWTCHVCGHTRPDDRIAVFTRRYDILSGEPAPDGDFVVNVRHCRDKPTCRLNAPRKADEWTATLRESARNRRAAAKVLRG
jgi:hypothetical protein